MLGGSRARAAYCGRDGRPVLRRIERGHLCRPPEPSSSHDELAVLWAARMGYVDAAIDALENDGMVVRAWDFASVEHYEFDFAESSARWTRAHDTQKLIDELDEFGPDVVFICGGDISRFGGQLGMAGRTVRVLYFDNHWHGSSSSASRSHCALVSAYCDLRRGDRCRANARRTSLDGSASETLWSRPGSCCGTSGCSPSGHRRTKDSFSSDDSYMKRASTFSLRVRRLPEAIIPTLGTSSLVVSDLSRNGSRASLGLKCSGSASPLKWPTRSVFRVPRPFRAILNPGASSYTRPSPRGSVSSPRGRSELRMYSYTG